MPPSPAHYAPPRTPSRSPSRSPSPTPSTASFPQTTLTLLPTTLSLVNIPRSRACSLTNPIVAHLLSSVPAEFLAVVGNTAELSIYADATAVARSGFARIAKKEHERLARMSKERAAQGRRKSSWRPVEISSQRWSVLQVESHDDQLDDAGARVHQISSALASASIPILFLSSHTADFILVKSCRLADAIARLGMEGYGLWSEDGISPFLGPLGGGRGGWMETHGGGEDVVLAPLSLDAAADDPPCGLGLLGLSLLEAEPASPAPSSHSLCTLRPSPSTSSAPTPAPTYPVSTLPGDLACVGLAEDSAPLWHIKLISLVAFPEHVLATHRRKHAEGISIREALQEEDGPEEWAAAAAAAEEEDGEEGEEDEWYEDDYEDYASSSSSSSGSRSRSHSHASSPSSSLSSLPLSSSPPSSPSSRPASHSRSPSARTPAAITALPFFALTRTRGATSLTASTRVLAKLFPPQERFMVLSSDEPDKYRCLQVDLSAFGLDKVGLANHLSDVLHTARVNHLYASTFRTANVLVPAADAERARLLLQRAPID